MLFLFIFGDDVEMAFGSVRYLFFYFASGILGGIAYVSLNQHSTTGLAGASGAIAAVLIANRLPRDQAVRAGDGNGAKRIYSNSSLLIRRHLARRSASFTCN